MPTARRLLSNAPWIYEVVDHAKNEFIIPARKPDGLATLFTSILIEGPIASVASIRGISLPMGNLGLSYKSYFRELRTLENSQGQLVRRLGVKGGARLLASPGPNW